MCISLEKSVNLSVCFFVGRTAYTYLHICTQIYIYIYMYVYMYIYI